jgi:hypothetical protein
MGLRVDLLLIEAFHVQGLDLSSSLGRSMHLKNAS